MRIDPRLCVGCGNCVAVCPMGAIRIDPATRRAAIDPDECVECFACYRGMSTERLNPVLVRGLRRALAALRLRFDPEPDVCPTSAIVPEKLTWPRTVRRAFSDVQVPHEETGVQGRGTEEVKTNDVTGRIVEGEAGFVVELGRPAMGVRFRDIERVARHLAAAGVRFEPRNPVTGLMSDASTGAIDPALRNEKVMSAIIEFKVDLARVPEVIGALEEVAGRIDTTMAVGASARCDAEGRNALEEVLAAAGYPPGRAKTNLGLGRLERAS
ncbi:MAG: 4Fe-4S dicluster domain-containing protein [Gemmatimonadota bacterium]